MSGRSLSVVLGVPAALTAPSWGGLAAPPGPVAREARGPLVLLAELRESYRLCRAMPVSLRRLGAVGPRAQACRPSSTAPFGVGGATSGLTAGRRPSAIFGSGLRVPPASSTRAEPDRFHGVRGLSPPPPAAGRVRSLPTASGLGVLGFKHPGPARPLPRHQGPKTPASRGGPGPHAIYGLRTERPRPQASGPGPTASTASGA